MCVIFIADGEDEYYAETDKDVRSYEEVNDEKSIEASDGTKSLEMTSDEYYANEISDEEKEEVVNMNIFVTDVTLMFDRNYGYRE